MLALTYDNPREAKCRLIQVCYDSDLNSRNNIALSDFLFNMMKSSL